MRARFFQGGLAIWPPPADHEFKLPLNRFLFSRKAKPRVKLIAGGPDQTVPRTVTSYGGFFGNVLDPDSSVFFGGLGAAAVDDLERANFLNVIKRGKSLERR